MDKTRSAGILLPIASLPSPYGVGDFGKEARSFADTLSKAGFKYWQILPLTPLGYGHSPYQPFSSFAMDELYVDLDDLKEKGYLDEIPPFGGLVKGKVSYEASREYKMPLLQKAYKKQVGEHPRCLDAFVKAHPWIKDYAAFMMFKRIDSRSWDNWVKENRDWILTRPALRGENRDAYRFEVWLQMTLYRQYDALHEYCHKLGISIIGDLPFYVGFDSCDVWANQDTFLLEESSKQPTFIAGVPPDYFSATGQRWGNPIYDWKKLEDTGFDFIINRIAISSKVYDFLRLDHFRAFDTYWKIPASCPTAIEGEWIEAPGYALFDRLLSLHPEVRIIAEDLGDLRPEVLTLRDHYDFPGMNVIQFTFDDDALMHKEGYSKVNSICYLGTHDNDTTRGYVAMLEQGRRNSWREALNSLGFNRGDMVEDLIDFCLSKPGYLAILSAQDVLGLDSSARLNVPGVVDDFNWTWRLDSLDELQTRLSLYRERLARYGRI